MPFTLSHAVAVLPLTRGRLGDFLVPAALVIGSMVPDLPYFVPPHRGSDWSHAASGPVTIDLAMGLGVYAVWQLVLRRPLVDLAPRWLAGRLPLPRRLTGRRWAAAAVSVILGALTHVLWDTFTHRARWGTDHVPALNALVGLLPAYKWFQFGSGVFGLLGLLLWIGLWLRRAPVRPVTPVLTQRVRVAAWAVVVLAFVGAVTALWLPAILAGSGLAEAVLFRLATGAISVTGATAVAVCLVWHAVSRLRRSDHRAAGQRPPDGRDG